MCVLLGNGPLVSLYSNLRTCVYLQRGTLALRDTIKEALKLN